MRGTSKRLLSVLVVIGLLAVPAVAGAVGGLSGPLFGLQTARNGDLLVADASVGVEVISNNQLVDSVSHHLEEEEETVLPKLDKLSDDEQHSIAEAFLETRAEHLCAGVTDLSKEELRQQALHGEVVCDLHRRAVHHDGHERENGRSPHGCGRPVEASAVFPSPALPGAGSRGPGPHPVLRNPPPTTVHWQYTGATAPLPPPSPRPGSPATTCRPRGAPGTSHGSRGA